MTKKDLIIFWTKLGNLTIVDFCLSEFFERKFCKSLFMYILIQGLVKE